MVESFWIINDCAGETRYGEVIWTENWSAENQRCGLVFGR